MSLEIPAQNPAPPQAQEKKPQEVLSSLRIALEEWQSRYQKDAESAESGADKKEAEQGLEDSQKISGYLDHIAPYLGSDLSIEQMLQNDRASLAQRKERERSALTPRAETGENVLEESAQINEKYAAESRVLDLVEVALKTVREN